MDYLLFTYPNCQKCEDLKAALKDAASSPAEVFKVEEKEGRLKIREFLPQRQARRQGRDHPSDARPAGRTGPVVGGPQHAAGARRRGCDQGAREVRPEGLSRASSPRRSSCPGCNFRCPYCHNADLVLAARRPWPTIPLDFFLAYLDSRKGWLEGICVSGGEPLLDPDIEDLLAVIKERDLLVKIDTNGSLPGPARAADRGRARRLGGHGRQGAARTAMPRSSGRPSIRRPSRGAPGSSGNPGSQHMFRTTVVPGLVGAEDIREDRRNGSAGRPSSRSSSSRRIGHLAIRSSQDRQAVHSRTRSERWPTPPGRISTKSSSKVYEYTVEAMNGETSWN